MKHYAYISISLITCLAMASCKSTRSVEESHNALQTIDVRSTHIDSMAQKRLFTFDELDYWLFNADSSLSLTDTADISPNAVHVSIKGGRLVTNTQTKTKTDADLKSADETTTRTKTETQTKAMQYTYINWFVAGIMVLLSLILIGPLRLPQGGGHEDTRTSND